MTDLKKIFQDFFFCELPFSETVISADGKVRPCAWILNDSKIMGNVFNEPFDEIWNNDKYIAFRQQIINSIDSINECSDCPKKNNPDFYLNGELTDVK